MFSKGLNRDVSPKNQPEGTYRDAKNASLIRKQGAITGEKGTESIDVSFGSGSEKNILGTCNLPNGNICIFSKQENDEIGILNPETNEYTSVYQKEDIGLSEDYPIQATSKLSDNGDIVVYWTDGLNEPRRLNLELDSYLNVRENDLSLFLTVRGVPRTQDLDVRDSGGILKTGTYHVALCYETANGDRTPFVYVSEPITVFDDVQGGESAALSMDGAPADTGTGKSIFLEIAGLDPRYEYVRPALIRGTEVRLLNQVTTFEDDVEEGYGVKARLTVSGGESYTPSSLEEITVDPESYESAQTIEQDSGMLYLGNLKKSPDIGFQKYANAITVEAVTEPVDVISDNPFREGEGIEYFSGHENDYRKARVQFEKKGFKRNEVYAFYISLIMKDGTETPAYHIPGRQTTENEREKTVTTDFEYYQELNEPKEFHLGTPTIVNGMGYWENQNEKYPAENADPDGDFEVWEVDSRGSGYKTGSIQGNNVRHHKMPDNKRDPFINSSGGGEALGVRLKNINIPNHILDKISGFKVHYAKRNIENARWVDQSPLYNVNYNGTADDGYDINHGTGSWSDERNDKYKGAYPFHMLRTNLNEGVLRYMQKVAQFPGDTFDGTRNINVMTPKDPNFNGDILDISTIDWASYIDMNQETYVGSGESDEYLNKYGSRHLLLESRSPDGRTDNHKTVDFFSHKVDVYYPFHAQELVSTGYGQNVTNDSSYRESIQTDEIFGGDTFICFYGLFVCEPAHDGELIGVKSIQQCIVESPDNIGLRHQGTGRYEVYMPKQDITDDERFQQGDYVTKVGSDEPKEALHFIAYNDEYSKLNNVKPTFPFNPQSNSRTEFPNRIARSVEPSDDLGDNFRQFLQESHHDLTGRKGEIKKLTNFSGMLLIHTERSLFRTIGREEMQVDGTRTFIGRGDILAQPPKEVYSSPEGYGGVFSHQHAILTPQGYFFADIKAGKVFQLTDGLKEISSRGMRDFFLDNLSGDVRIGYNPQDNKIFLTHHGENPYTISYAPSIKAWESFHTGQPEIYFWGQKYLYCIHNDSLGNPKIWVRGDQSVNEYMVGKYFDSHEDLEIELVHNKNPFQEKVLHSVIVDGLFGKKTDPPKTISVFDDIEQTGVKDIIYFTEPGGNARRTSGVWRINGLRSDDTEPSGTMPAWVRRRMIGQWWNIRLTADAENALIYAITANTQPSIR